MPIDKIWNGKVEFLEHPSGHLKSKNRQYLGLKAKNEKSKSTLFSQTFKVSENNVPLFFSFLASRPRYWR